MFKKEPKKDFLTKKSKMFKTNLKCLNVKKLKTRNVKKQLTHRLSFAQMLDQMPSELSAAGAKQGVRSVPSRHALGSSRPSVIK